MASQVIKRDGSKEAFDASKIRGAIRGAAEGAGLSEERVEKLVEEVGNVIIGLADEREVIAAREIRAMALNELDRVAPLASAAWRSHDAEKE